jgi:hypothetical protein
MQYVYIIYMLCIYASSQIILNPITPIEDATRSSQVTGNASLEELDTPR